MIDESVKALILMGEDVEIHGITIRNYKLKEIFDKKIMGLDKYYMNINLCTLLPKDILPREALAHDELKDITLFKICLFVEQIKDKFIEFLDLFTTDKWMFNPDFCEFVTSYDKNRKVIDESLMHEIFKITQEMYCVVRPKKESDRDDIDDEMKAMLLEFEEQKAKAKGGVHITLLSIIEFVSTKHPSLNLINIWEYTMYKLMKTYYRLEHISNYEQTVSAMYSGTISSKDIDLEKMHWANEISL